MAFDGQEDRPRNSTASHNGYELGDVPPSNLQQHTMSRTLREIASLENEFAEPIEETSLERRRLSQAVNSASRGLENEKSYYPIKDVPDGYPELNYRPTVLSNLALFAAFLFFGGCMSGLVTILIMDHTQQERLHIQKSSYRLLAKYLPVVIGSLTATWSRALRQSFTRIAPYALMAAVPVSSSKSRKDRASRSMHEYSVMSFFDLSPSSIISLIRQGHTMVPLVNITNILTSILLVPFKAGLLQITTDNLGWQVEVIDVFAFILLGLYGMLTFCVVGIFFYFINTQTGLKWEPASLAAQLTLLKHMNSTQAFRGMEYCTRLQMNRLASTWENRFGVLRLGYFRCTDGQGKETTVHGIRFIKNPEASESTSDQTSASESDDWSVQRENDPIAHFYYCSCDKSTYTANEAPEDYKHNIMCSPEYVRYRFVPPILWDSTLLVFETIAFICIAISVFHIANKTIHNPIDVVPTLTADPTSYIGRLEVSLIYSFLPALVFVVFSITFLNADVHYRTTQALHSLSKPQLAKKNLLLDYISPNPGTLILNAISAGHYRVAMHSFLALMSTYSVVVAGRMFDQEVVRGVYHLTISPTNFYASVAILCVYVLILPFSRPPVAYRSPRNWFSIIDTASFVYDSVALRVKDFDVQGASDREEHLNASVLLGKKLWVFGMYRGVSGRMRLGLSPITDDDGKIVEVDQIESKWFCDLGFWRNIRGKPSIVKSD